MQIGDQVKVNTSPFQYSTPATVKLVGNGNASDFTADNITNESTETLIGGTVLQRSDGNYYRLGNGGAFEQVYPTAMGYAGAVDTQGGTKRVGCDPAQRPGQGSTVQTGPGQSATVQPPQGGDPANIFRVPTTMTITSGDSYVS